MALIINERGRVCLQQRPPSGIWGGLWSFPEYESLEALRAGLTHDGAEDIHLERWPVIRHSFTHFQLEITPVLVRIGAAAGGVRQQAGRWINAESLPDLGLAAPVAGLLNRLSEQLAGRSAASA